MLIDNIDFIGLYKWLWHRHGDAKMRGRAFSNSAETFIISNYEGQLTDETNIKVIKALISMDLLNETLTEPNKNCDQFVVYNLVHHDMLDDDHHED